MRIANNIMAMNAHRQLMVNQGGVSKSIEKLSSGLRINRAGDDAAGLSISEKMRGQIRGLRMASRNAQDGISVVQTAEGALGEIHEILQRVRELAVQADNLGALQEDDQDAIQQEVEQLLEEIDAIAERTEFNEKKLLDGSYSSQVFQVGANAEQQMKVTIADLSAQGLSIDTLDVVFTSETDFDTAIASIDGAIKTVSEQRSNLGAVQNRLEHTIANLDNAAENLQAAEARIRDVDMAHEMMTFTKFQILQQASTAMLAQANLAPQSVLQLLG